MKNHGITNRRLSNRAIFVTCIIILFILTSYLNNTKAKTVNKNYKNEGLSEQYKDEGIFVKNIKNNDYELNKNEQKILITQTLNPLPKSEIKKITISNDYENIFKDDVFIGDSITTGLYIYKLINEKNVSAKVGIDTIQLANEIEKIKINKPNNIYILCGINDVIGNNDCEIFKANYNELIKVVKSKNLNTNIYVQSILPIYKGVDKSKPNLNNEYIRKFNIVLQNVAKEQNVKYIDITSLIDCNDNKLYQSDGIHLKPNFYYSWLAFLVEKTKEVS